MLYVVEVRRKDAHDKNWIPRKLDVEMRGSCTYAEGFHARSQIHSIRSYSRMR